jgi:hypothetical protein
MSAVLNGQLVFRFTGRSAQDQNDSLGKNLQFFQYYSICFIFLLIEPLKNDSVFDTQTLFFMLKVKVIIELFWKPNQMCSKICKNGLVIHS